MKAHSSSTKLTYVNSSSLESAVDIALEFVTAWSHESEDRKTLALLNNQDALVESVAKVNQQVIVIYHGPGAILMPWT